MVDDLLRRLSSKGAGRPFDVESQACQQSQLSSCEKRVSCNCQVRSRWLRREIRALQILACVLQSWSALTRRGMAVGSRRGFGRFWHVQNRHLWVQQRVQEGRPSHEGVWATRT